MTGMQRFRSRPCRDDATGHSLHFLIAEVYNYPSLFVVELVSGVTCGAPTSNQPQYTMSHIRKKQRTTDHEPAEMQIAKESDEEHFEEQIDESQIYEYQMNADDALVGRVAPLATSPPSDSLSDFVKMSKSITEYSDMINSLIVEIGRPGPRVASECSLCKSISHASIEQL